MNPLLRYVAIMAAVASSSVQAQSATGEGHYPSRPIRWILPFPAGGPSDVVARLVGQRLGERLKQPVIIDNRPGAGGSIGMELTARALPDGHTIVFGAPGSVVINPLVNTAIPDPLAELTAVSRLTTFPFIVVASPSLEARGIGELLEKARSNPGSVTCGAGAALQQVACELLKLQGRAAITTIPYKGSAPALNDLIAGRISFVFEVPNVAAPQVNANRARAIATTSAKAGDGPFPHLSRINETLPGFEIESWFGVLAPRATSREIVARLDGELRAILAEDGMRKRLLESGLEPAHAPAEVFLEVIQRDRTRYAKVIREAGIKGEGS